MKFGELTISQLLLTAFSGFGVVFISWILGKKIKKYIQSKDKGIEIIQKDNEVKGDMAGGNIIRNSNAEQIDSKRVTSTVRQTGNKVEGDMAGGNITKRVKDE